MSCKNRKKNLPPKISKLWKTVSRQSLIGAREVMRVFDRTLVGTSKTPLRTAKIAKKTHSQKFLNFGELYLGRDWSERVESCEFSTELLRGPAELH
ncbi:hypothetical protein PUN28_002184 [Cardiocondyla obscurior]|uniref:Uncharacterized protein n=1 Tax=Cardiocondyla obscurior TaxID=286306 RepID=A0AAW2GSW4_9HYME